MCQQLLNSKKSSYNTNLKPYSKVISKLALILCLLSLLAACTPYNNQVYGNNGNVARPFITQPSNSTINTNQVYGNNGNVARPFITQSSNLTTNNTFAYYPSNTSESNGSSTSNNNTAPNVTTPVDQGVRALLECTAELGYTSGFTANDYQNCLQFTQAILTDYAFNILSNYIMSWADFAIDQALQALGFVNGRSLGSSQAKSSELTSIILTSYRWYN